MYVYPILRIMHRPLSQSCAEQIKSFAGGHNPWLQCSVILLKSYRLSSLSNWWSFHFLYPICHVYKSREPANWKPNLTNSNSYLPFPFNPKNYIKKLLQCWCTKQKPGSFKILMSTNIPARHDPGDSDLWDGRMRHINNRKLGKSNLETLLLVCT